jgi:hypothetical protein
LYSIGETELIIEGIIGNNAPGSRSHTVDSKVCGGG